MFCHVVMFCVVLICIEPLGADETKPSLADQLNATLSFPGWKRMTEVAAKYRNAFNGNESFTGKDLFVSDNLFFDNENSVNTLVSDENASVKHYMVTHLMACIYVKAMMKFTDLLKIIFEEVTRVRRNLRVKSNRQNKNKLDNVKRTAEEAGPVQIETTVQQSFEGCEENGSNSGAIRTDEKFIDYKEPWEIFNFALLQLTNSSTMFDVMLSTMRYLIDTIPSGEPYGHDPYLRELLDIQVVPSLKLFQDVSKNINIVLPEYIGKTDPEYNDKVSPFNYKFIWFLNNVASTKLRPFLKNVCTVSETASTNLMTEVSIFKDKYFRKPTSLDIAHQLGEDIGKLVHKVCNNYYSQLGFLYDNREQTTSYAIPPTL